MTIEIKEISIKTIISNQSKSNHTPNKSTLKSKKTINENSRNIFKRKER